MAAKKKTVKDRLKAAEKKAKSVGVFEDGEDMKELLKDKPKAKKRKEKQLGGAVKKPVVPRARVAPNKPKASSDFTFSY